SVTVCFCQLAPFVSTLEPTASWAFCARSCRNALPRGAAFNTFESFQILTRPSKAAWSILPIPFDHVQVTAYTALTGMNLRAGDKVVHVELLRNDGHVLVGVEPGLAHPGEELEFVAEPPAADLLALEVCDRADAGGLERDLGRRRSLEDLADDLDVRAALARSEHSGDPGNAELGLAAGDDGRGNDVDR